MNNPALHIVLGILGNLGVNAMCLAETDTKTEPEQRILNMVEELLAMENPMKTANALPILNVPTAAGTIGAIGLIAVEMKPLIETGLETKMSSDPALELTPKPKNVVFLQASVESLD